MSHQFEPGQSVYASRDTRSLSGVNIPRDAAGRVSSDAETNRSDGRLAVRFPAHENGKALLIKRADLAPASGWSDVEVGDVVIFRPRGMDPMTSGEERTAYDQAGTPTVLGISTRSLVIGEAWELLSIEKPKPSLPTTNGSIIRRTEGYGLPEAALIEGDWAMVHSGNLAHPEDWADGWVLVRDAGEDS